MPTTLEIPPPPAGFVPESSGIPEPPAGFVPETTQQIPPPPAGFVPESGAGILKTGPFKGQPLTPEIRRATAAYEPDQETLPKVNAQVASENSAYENAGAAVIADTVNLGQKYIGTRFPQAAADLRADTNIPVQEGTASATAGHLTAGIVEHPEFLMGPVAAGVGGAVQGFGEGRIEAADRRAMGTGGGAGDELKLALGHALIEGGYNALLAKLLGGAGGNVAKQGVGALVKEGAQTAVKQAAVAAPLGGIAQGATNALTGRPLGEGVLQRMGTDALVQGGFGAVHTGLKLPEAIKADREYNAAYPRQEAIPAPPEVQPPVEPPRTETTPSVADTSGNGLTEGDVQNQKSTALSTTKTPVTGDIESKTATANEGRRPELPPPPPGFIPERPGEREAANLRMESQRLAAAEPRLASDTGASLGREGLQKGENPDPIAFAPLPKPKTPQTELALPETNRSVESGQPSPEGTQAGAGRQEKQPPTKAVRAIMSGTNPADASVDYYDSTGKFRTKEVSASSPEGLDALLESEFGLVRDAKRIGIFNPKQPSPSPQGRDVTGGEPTQPQKPKPVKWDKGKDFMDDSDRYSISGRDPSNTLEPISAVITSHREPEFKGGNKVTKFYGTVEHKPSETQDRIGPFKTISEAKAKTEALFNKYRSEFEKAPAPGPSEAGKPNQPVADALTPQTSSGEVGSPKQAGRHAEQPTATPAPEANSYSEQSYEFFKSVRDSKDLKALLANFGDKSWVVREAQRVLNDSRIDEALTKKFRQVQKMADKLVVKPRKPAQFTKDALAKQVSDANATGQNERAKLLNAVHDTIPPERAKTSGHWGKNPDMTEKTGVTPADEPVGTTFAIQKEPVEIKTNASGAKVLEDGSRLPTVKVDEVGRIPMDKGSLRPPESSKPPESPKTPPSTPVSDSVATARGEDPRVFSPKHEDLHREAKLLDIQGLPSRERLAKQKAIDEAHRQGIPDKALDIAADVMANPYALDPIEKQGLNIRRVRIAKEHAKLDAELQATKDPADRALKTAELNRLQQDDELLIRALDRSGSEAGAALQSQQNAVDITESLVATKSAARLAKGKDLTPKESADIENLQRELTATRAKLDAAEKIAKDREATDTIRKSKIRKQPVDLATKTARLKELLSAGCV